MPEDAEMRVTADDRPRWIEHSLHPASDILHPAFRPHPASDILHPAS
jgi:hypothetical protein